MDEDSNIVQKFLLKIIVEYLVFNENPSSKHNYCWTIFLNIFGILKKVLCSIVHYIFGIFSVDHDVLIANMAICPKCGVMNTKCGFPAMAELH